MLRSPNANGTVGSKYDRSRVEAHLALGVLTLTLAKAEETTRRQVAVTAY